MSIRKRENQHIEFDHRRLNKRDLINIEKIILKHAKPSQLSVARFRKRYVSVKYMPKIRIMFLKWETIHPAFDVVVYPFHIRIDIYTLYHVSKDRDNINKMINEICKYVSARRVRVLPPFSA